MATVSVLVTFNVEGKKEFDEDFLAFNHVDANSVFVREEFLVVQFQTTVTSIPTRYIREILAESAEGAEF